MEKWVKIDNNLTDPHTNVLVYYEKCHNSLTKNVRCIKFSTKDCTADFHRNWRKKWGTRVISYLLNYSTPLQHLYHGLKMSKMYN